MNIEAVFNEHSNMLVRIDNDVYEMNDNAHLPNGLCMYLGSWETWQDQFQGKQRIVVLPIGTVRAIAYHARESALNVLN